jgi:hypothetical protein
MYYIVIIVFLVIFVYLNQNKEMFNTGFNYGKSFGEYIAPQDCTPENNCFPGAYLRSQAYTNVCEPDYGLLTRDKVQLKTDCYRTLGNFPEHKKRFNCCVDNHLNRHCSWQ